MVMCFDDFVVILAKVLLMWQNIDYSKEKKYRWQEAVNYCEASTLGGYDNWRLPTRDELKSLGNIELYGEYNNNWSEWFNKNKNKRLKNSKGNSYFIKKEFLENMPEYSYFWTSTEIERKYKEDIKAWVVYFGYGDDYWRNKSSSYFVRCVR